MSKKILWVGWLFMVSQVMGQDVPSPDPEFQKEQFVLQEGLEINLFASDPMIQNPIQMNWDERGRLWVVCSTLYPQILPGQKPQDKIVILEDLDRDGVAESYRVFAEGLFIPTAVLPYGDGAIVANSTELIWLHDRDQDGHADPDGREVLLTGFGTEDTHHILHTLTRGPDGTVFFNQSVYIHSHVETPFGIRRMNGGGIWRFEPESGRLEPYASGLINPWGFDFNREGDAFATDGAGYSGINYVFPGSNHQWSKTPGLPILPGMSDKHPKYCGLEIIDSLHFPESWQGSMATCDFRGNRIVRFAVLPEGSGFRSEQMPDLVNSRHRAFRPVDLRLGPDGALYICDFYNPIIQHGEVDFRDPRRDHEHGRIWRLRYQGRERVDYKTVRAPADYQMPAVMKETVQPTAWNLSIPGDWAALSAKERLWWVLHESRGFYTDQDVVHRRAPGSLPRLLGMLDQPMDPWMDFALSTYCLKTAPSWLPVYLQGGLKFQQPTHLIYALQHSGDARALTILMDKLGGGDSSLETRRLIYQLLKNKGNAGDLDYALAHTSRPEAELFAALRGALQERKISPSKGKAQVLAWLEDIQVDAGLRGEAARLLGEWKFPGAEGVLRALASDASQPPALQVGAIQAITIWGGESSEKALAALLASDRPDVRSAAVTGLLRLQPARAVEAVVTMMQGSESPATVEKLVLAIAQNKQALPLMVAALAGKTIPAPMAEAGLRAAGSAALSDSSLLDALRTAGGIGAMSLAASPEKIASWLARVPTEGDAARGELVYRKAELSCMVCHAIGEGGGIIGPNLQSIGASAQVDYLIESLLEPSKKIKEGFHTTMITTKDGQVYAGMLVQDGPVKTIRDASGVSRNIASDAVESQSNSPVSLMPPGLTASLTEPEFIDLVRFLSELGREGGVKLSPRTFVRNWEGLQADGSWKVLPARIDGFVPLAEAPGGSLRAVLDTPVAVNAVFENNAKAQLTMNDDLFRGSPRPIPAGTTALRVTWPIGSGGEVRLELQK